MGKMLVVSAHPGDVLWRCAGAVAKNIKEGGEVRIISLSYGSAGESVALWDEDGMTYEKVKKTRDKQFSEAQKILGVEEAEIWGLDEYPMLPTREDMRRLAKCLREFQPDTILTHFNCDSLNPDHGSVLKYVMDSMEIAGGNGIYIAGTVPSFPRATIYCFEPHVPEASGFQPNVFVDISDVWEIKDKVMACMSDKANIRKMYTDRAVLRAQNAKSFGRKNCEYAEAYWSVYPFAKTGNFPQ